MTHHGSLTFPPDHPVTVFSDGNKRTLALSGVEQYFALEGKLKNFLMHLSTLVQVPATVMAALERPDTSSHKGQEIAVIDAQVFLMLAESVAKAKNEGFLFASEIQIGKTAELILKNFPPAHLNELIDAASGYRLYKDNLKRILADFLVAETQRSLFRWVNTMPDSFFDVLINHLGAQWKDMKDAPSKIGTHVMELIFSRLPDQVLENLLISKPRMKYGKNGLTTRYLPAPGLEKHLSVVETAIKLSHGSPGICTQLLNQLTPVRHPYLIAPLNEKRQELPEELLPVIDMIRLGLS